MPKRLELTISIASSSVAAVITHSTGPKTSSLGDRHLGRDGVEDRRADEGALRIEAAVAIAAVDDDRAPSALAARDPAADPVACRARDRPVRRRWPRRGRRRPSAPGWPATSAGISRSCASPTVTTTEPAMHRWPAAPNAEPMIAVDRLVDDGVRHHDHVVLGAAERLDALAGARRALVDELAHRRRADERDRVDPGMGRGSPRRSRARR